MVDRLEELLALIEDEDGGDEREDGLELAAEAAVPAVPAPEIDAEGAPEDSTEKTAAALSEDGDIRTETEKAERPPEVRAPAAGGWDEAPEAEKPAGGMAGNEAAEHGAAEFWRDALAALAAGRKGSFGLRETESGNADLAEPGGQAGRMDPVEESGASDSDSMWSAEKSLEGLKGPEGLEGLEELYRQAVRADRPAVWNLPAEGTGRTVRAGEPERTAVLTVDELDRAVRRDSWRYDGGMTIY